MLYSDPTPTHQHFTEQQIKSVVEPILPTSIFNLNIDQLMAE